MEYIRCTGAVLQTSKTKAFFYKKKNNKKTRLLQVDFKLIV